MLRPPDLRGWERLALLTVPLDQSCEEIGMAGRAVVQPPNRRGLLIRLGGLGVALVGTPAALAGTRRFAWPDGARAAVSLTYDDGLNSQLDNVVPVLDALGLKATFFLTEENMEARLADWVKVAREGHEMGDHTVTHPCRLKRETAGDFLNHEITPMEAFLDRNFDPGQHTYAYPCGFIALGEGPKAVRRNRYLTDVSQTFLAARLVIGDPNDPRRAMRDRFELHAFEPTYDRDDPAPAFAYVDKALRQGGWAILVFHEVLPRRLGEGDTSIAVHRRILEWLVRQPVWCAPMRDVFLHVRQSV